MHAQTLRCSPILALVATFFSLFFAHGPALVQADVTSSMWHLQQQFSECLNNPGSQYFWIPPPPNLSDKAGTQMGPKYTSSDVVAGIWSHRSIWSLQGVAGTRTSLVAQMVKNLLTVQEIWVWSQKIPWRREWQPTPVFLPGEFHDRPWGSKESDTTNTPPPTHTHTHAHSVWLNVYLQTFSAGKPDNFVIWVLLYALSDQFSRSVVSDSLRPCEPQHARPPCPSPTPGVYSNPCPWSWWCHPAISSSVVPFSSCPRFTLHFSYGKTLWEMECKY